MQDNGHHLAPLLKTWEASASGWYSKRLSTQQPQNRHSLMASHMIQCWYGSCSTATAFLLQI